MKNIKVNEHGTTIKRFAGRKGGRRRVKKGFATNPELASEAGKKGMKTRWGDKKIKITILGQTPSKKNSRINTRSGRSFPSKKYTEWHKNSSLQLKPLISIRQRGVNGKVTIKYVFYVQDYRRRDVSNMIESINDLLVDVGILEDDDWKHVRIGSGDAELDRENPRAEIEICS